jgi:hypothetical protein
MSANKSRQVAIERRASRSADFALREFEFRIVQQWRARGNADRGAACEVGDCLRPRCATSEFGGDSC